MLARKIFLQMKPNSVAEFTRTSEHDIMPWLRTQPGCQDEMTCVSPGGTEGIGISIWDQKENAEA